MVQNQLILRYPLRQSTRLGFEVEATRAYGDFRPARHCRCTQARANMSPEQSTMGFNRLFKFNRDRSRGLLAA